MTFGSLFAGIGGMDLGLERAGMECRWQVEIDPYARKVLEKHWPHVPKLEDVRDVGAHNLEPVDLIAGGFPCQPVSVAGKRAGQSDERWMWPEFARILRELRPRLALLENVPGLLVWGFGEVLGDLASLGYDAEWGVLGADDVGAPHRRKRVFLVAHPRGAGLEGCGPGGPARDDGEPWDMANTPGARRDHRTPGAGGPLRHEARSQELERFRREVGGPQWGAEPDVGRVADGVPARVDRLRGLGNAVVPQVAEWIGRRIMEAAR